jgi:probable O-glycosylation ligase (exosortase A-associated)
VNKREILVLALLAAGILYGLRYPIVACALFTWNNIFRPLPWARADGFLDPAVLPVHFITPIVLAVSLLSRPWQLRWNAGCSVLVVVLAWVWFGAPFALHPDHALEEALEVTKYLVPLILIGTVLSDRKAQLAYLYVLALSVGVHLAWAGFHGVFLKGGIERWMGIPGGQMTGRNGFMVGATACLPLLGFMAFAYEGPRPRAARWGLRAMFVLGAVAFLYSGSRGAIVGLVCLLLWWAVMTGRPARRLTTAMIVGVVALPLVPGFVWERMGTIELGLSQKEGSAAERLEVMKFGVDLTLEHPVVGVGLDNSAKVASDFGHRLDRPGVGIETHCIWLKCSSEHGIPMLVFFLGVVGTLLVRLRAEAREARSAGDPQTEHMATALSCSLVGFLVTATFGNQFLNEYLWSIITLAFAFLSTLGTNQGTSQGGGQVRA